MDSGGRTLAWSVDGVLLRGAISQDGALNEHGLALGDELRCFLRSHLLICLGRDALAGRASMRAQVRFEFGRRDRNCLLGVRWRVQALGIVLKYLLAFLLARTLRAGRVSLAILLAECLELGLNLEVIIGQAQLIVGDTQAASLLGRGRDLSGPALTARRSLTMLRLHRKNGSRHALLAVAGAAAAVQLAFLI